MGLLIYLVVVLIIMVALAWDFYCIERAGRELRNNIDILFYRAGNSLETQETILREISQAGGGGGLFHLHRRALFWCRDPLAAYPETLRRIIVEPTAGVRTE